MKTKIIFILIILVSVSSFAQKNTAEYAKNIKQGNLNILEQNYLQALKYLFKAYHIDSLNANINYKIGLCYLQTSANKKKALPFLEKASENISHNYSMDDPNEKVAPEDTYRLLGIAYRIQNNLKESNLFFTKFKELVGTKNKEINEDLDRQIQMNLNAADFLLDVAELKIKNLGDKINTQYPDYTPVVSADESTIYFTSRRPGGTSDEKNDDDQYYEDIYVSNKTKDGKWDTPKSIGLTINSVGDESALSITADGRQLLMYRDINNGDIYSSIFDGTNWSGATPLNSTVNTKDAETHAIISKDGNTLYFVSDRKQGSVGGRDIWMCTKLPDGLWSAASNLGPTINTPFDEESPYLSPDGNTLYFSSKGHKNMGGFDIFKSTKDKDGNWTEAENMRPPINTTDDDVCYVQSFDGKHAYFSAVRDGGLGDKDLYVINLEKVSEKITVIKGNVTFDGTTKIPENAHIIASDKATGTVEQDVIANKNTGSYLILTHPGKTGKEYNLVYEAPGFQTVNQVINVPPNSSYDEIQKELLLKTVNMESKTSGTMNITGTIKDSDGKPIPGSQVVVKNNVTGELISANYTKADSGTYYFILKSGENYNLSYVADGYLFKSENINIPKRPDYSVISKNIILEKIQLGAKIILNNIFFDSNKATLRPESNPEIDKLFSLLDQNPKIFIEIYGHTDNKGNAAANLSLSQQRAQAVLNELVKKGIAASRLKAKGFGSTMPIAPNALPDGKPDLEGMQLNRRVEMKITQAQ